MTEDQPGSAQYASRNTPLQNIKTIQQNVVYQPLRVVLSFELELIAYLAYSDTTKKKKKKKLRSDISRNMSGESPDHLSSKQLIQGNNLLIKV